MPTTMPVVDVDSHVIEPADLWTSRVSPKYREQAPHVVADPKTGRQLPPATAQVAHQQASHLVDEILASRRGHPPTPFKYRPMGSLVSLGPASAAAEFPAPSGVITFSGALPKVFCVSLQLLHRAALLGWVRAVALSLADSLRRITAPPVKLH